MGAETLLIMGAVASAGAAVYSGIEAQKQGREAHEMADIQAQALEEEAEARRRKGAFDQERQVEAAQREMGELTAGLSFAGAVPSKGYALNILGKQASELKLENLLMGYESGLEASRSESQAGFAKMQGDIERRRGRSRAIGSYTGAGGSLLSGLGMAGLSDKFAAMSKGLPWSTAKTVTGRTPTGGFYFGR